MSTHKTETADPYANASVHALWPLVADPEAPGGLRFAELGRDRPSDCVASVDALPEADVALHTFRTAETRDAWAAAAREFGGNAVLVVPGPHAPNVAFQTALVMRFDRDRNPGATLAEVVGLRRDREAASGSPQADISAVGAAWRKTYLERVSEDAQRAAWNETWKSEIAVLDGSRRLGRDPLRVGREPGLPFEIDPPFGMKGSLRKTPEGVRVVLDTRGLDRLGGENYGEAWRIAVEARGWDASDPAAVAVDLPKFGHEQAERVAKDIDVLAPTIARLTRLSKSWTEVVAMASDAEMVKVVGRLASSMPLASTLYRDPGAQLSPRTATAASVAGTRIERAFVGGLIEPVWWQDRNPNEQDRELPVPTVHEMRGILWGLTATGQAFAQERWDEAAETHAADVATALTWARGRMQKGSRIPQPFAGPEVIAERFRIEDPRVVDAVGRILVRYRDGADLLTWADELSRMAACIGAGHLVFDGRKLYRPQPQASAPSP
jgi:hypothetical protein